MSRDRAVLRTSTTLATKSRAPDPTVCVRASSGSRCSRRKTRLHRVLVEFEQRIGPFEGRVGAMQQSAGVSGLASSPRSNLNPRASDWRTNGCRSQAASIPFELPRGIVAKRPCEWLLGSLTGCISEAWQTIPSERAGSQATRATTKLKNTGEPLPPNTTRAGQAPRVLLQKRSKQTPEQRLAKFRLLFRFFFLLSFFKDCQKCTQKQHKQRPKNNKTKIRNHHTEEESFVVEEESSFAVRSQPSLFRTEG